MRSARGAGREHHLDLGDRSGVEAGAQRDQKRQQLGRRVRLDGIEHPAVRQSLGKGRDNCRARRRDRRQGTDHRPGPRRGGGAGSRGCARSLARSFPVQGALRWPTLKFSRPRLRADDRRQRRKALGASAVRWGHGQARGASAEMLPWIGAGEPVPHGRQDKDGQASSVLTFGRPTRPKKPAPSLL